MRRFVQFKVFRRKCSDIFGGEIVEAANVNLVWGGLQSVDFCGVIRSAQYRFSFVRIGLCKNISSECLLCRT